MQPNNPNLSNFSDQALYYLQQSQRARAPPNNPNNSHAQITFFEPQPQLIDIVAPIEAEAAASAAAASTCQQRKRTSRADRHSKIRTAQGERDRRMRLSVQVAHQFFALQDRLGFDKASKTIDWLLTQAKDSINQLSSSSSSSEPPKEEIPTDHTVIADQSPLSDYEPVHHATAMMQISSNQAGEFQPTAKDLRVKARARARERAREKKVASCQLDQLVLDGAASANAQMDENCNSMEYYYYLLNEILNGGFCSVDIEDDQGTTSAGVH